MTAGQWNDLFRLTAEPPEVNLCQYGSGCFGCCGENYGKKEDVWEGLERNTQEFHDYRRYSQLIAFRDRYGPAQRTNCGLCPNVIMMDNGKLGCPLHPQLNLGMDLRMGFCNNSYFCGTYRNYLAWEEGKRQRFIAFLARKKLDWYDYSNGMINGTLRKEFERLEKNPLRRWFGLE